MYLGNMCSAREQANLYVCTMTCGTKYVRCRTFLEPNTSDIGLSIHLMDTISIK